MKTVFIIVALLLIYSSPIPPVLNVVVTMVVVAVLTNVDKCEDLLYKSMGLDETGE